MSLACGLPLLECVYFLGFARWAWKRCVHTGYHDSATWGHAATSDFAPIRRMCRLVMANYETNLAAPLLDPSNVVRSRTYADTGGLNLAASGSLRLTTASSGGYAHGFRHSGQCDLLRDLLDRYPD
ncbi:hypothetical protein ZWY2020_048530 [Hordeum vulgare]|nr:hypothetical protein ZWY2020_048530 [Hordeum vulgare]